MKGLVVPHLLAAPTWPRVCSFLQLEALSDGGGDANSGAGESEGGDAGSAPSSAAAAAFESLPAALTSAMKELYVRADRELVERCREQKNDYASSTSVTALLAGKFLAVGHVVRSPTAEARAPRQTDKQTDKQTERLREGAPR